MKKLAVLFVCVALLASCDGFKGGSKDLKAENDSLLMELNQRNAELDDMMGTFNEVQEGFRKINAAESRVDLQRGTITENSASAKQQIASDIEFISKQMEENKAQIAKLQAQLKNSNYNSAQMKKAVAALTAELNAKQQRIEELQTELASKNIRIQELDAAVSDLSAAKETLAAENEAKAKTVAEQEKSLNAAWFVFGTKSELKAQKILQSGDVLKSADFNKDYFTQIDIRTTKEIKLYSKRAELLTTHPAGSYELVKDAKGQLTLKITNPSQFWSVSRYLVIQVKYSPEYEPKRFYSKIYIIFRELVSQNLIFMDTSNCTYKYSSNYSKKDICDLISQLKSLEVENCLSMEYTRVNENISDLFQELSIYKKYLIKFPKCSELINRFIDQKESEIHLLSYELKALRNLLEAE